MESIEPWDANGKFNVDKMICKIKIGKKYLPGEFSEPVMADLAALAMVKEDNSLIVDVYCKKKVRYRRCFRATKENYQRQTIRIETIAAATSNEPEMDFFKMIFGGDTGN